MQMSWKRFFGNSHNDIGAFLIEPIMGNCCGLTATKQYLQDVRSLCDKYNVVLIVDEVKTGFRVAKGGVQELLGVEADLCTFAKALANGYPISVVAGREDIMRTLAMELFTEERSPGIQCHWLPRTERWKFSMKQTPLRRVRNYGLEIQAGIGKVLAERAIPHSFVGHPSMMGLFFSDDAPGDYRDWIIQTTISMMRWLLNYMSWAFS